MNRIITIGRQFGSGGSEIGKKLAEKLGIAYYDKNLIELASEKSGISKKVFEKADERHNSFLYSLSMAHYGGLVSPVYLNDVITNDKLFIIQSNIIKEIAAKESCVIVGRCASDILADTAETFDVFVHASLEYRTQRIMRLYDMPANSAQTLIKKTDKSRSSYFDFYSSKSWGACETYDISINSEFLGIDGCVNLLSECVEKKFK